MDSFMLQDEGVRDRIRQAEEFLDPSMISIPLLPQVVDVHKIANLVQKQTIPMPEATDQT